MAELTDERVERLLKAVQQRFEMGGSEDDLLLKDCLCELLERRERERQAIDQWAERIAADMVNAGESECGR
jgi:hypothetical protein